jgi:ligand-binding SRPBCC domain-containing protein
MAERHLTVRRRVPAPSDAVWAFFADFPSLADHWNGIRSSRPLGDQRDGVGARRHVELKPIGSMVETATEWEVGHTIATVNEPSILVPFKRAESKLSLEADGDETSISFDYRYVPRGGAIGTLTGLVIDRMLRKTFEDMLTAVEVQARTDR